MADLEDYQDAFQDGGDAGGMDANDLNRQLFGEESDDEQAAPAAANHAAAEAALEDQIDEADAEAALEDDISSGDEKKAKKAKGSARKKREGGKDGDKPKKKRQRTAEGGDKPKRSKGEKGEKGAKGAGARPRRTPGGAEEGEARPRRTPGEQRERAPGEGPVPDEELSDDLKEGEADRAFIDDEGVEPVPSDDDEAARIGNADEAEEAMDAEEDHPFKRKKKKEPTGNVELEIKEMLGKMEAAMEHDMETVSRNAGVELKKDSSDNLVTDAEGHYVVARTGPPPTTKRPAISKLKLLPELELFLAQRKYHESFLSQGGLGVLKGWLEPYFDGTLPNVRVRTAVLKGLQTLPIDTRHEDHKEMLRKSQLGKNVMFLFKCGEETPENRRIAKELVHRWSRPIFYDAEAEEAKKQLHQQQLLVARRMELERRKDAPEDDSAGAAVRNKAMRIHALIPRASKLDYVNNPGAAKDFNESEMAAAAAAQAPKAKQVDALTKRLREQQKKLRDSNARAMKPSVEGRSIVLMK
ncbi:hypothetical protein HYH03_000977 [Edaphochlamys debaryana]|uniref:TFIIS N-terminal domain-containing protein n=1 Tax=Edaphochlamys debaryana TaxID=47281 RepID=A0A836C6W9_9CHLO|nr:hypothetical protein HYH03_000977 [Edaphochlamys debaryana]|eukprot:KAG2501162.1 hypothetical protein HYH03_000977 [Edaphochlamys debaryana]